MLNAAVARNTTALPLKRSATMPRCGSAENVIATDCDGLSSISPSSRGSVGPRRIAVINSLTLGVTTTARNHGLSTRCPPLYIAAAKGGFTTTVVLAEPGMTVAVAGRRGIEE